MCVCLFVFPGPFSADSCSISPSSDEKETCSMSPDFTDSPSDITRPSDITLVLSDSHGGKPKPNPPTRSNSLPHDAKDSGARVGLPY